MGKQRPTSGPVLPSWAITGAVPKGQPVINSTMDTANGSDGKNDVGLVPGMDQNEVRASNQTTGEKWKNGLTKMAGTAVTSFAEPFLDMLVGGTEALTNDGSASSRLRAVYDNSATQAMDGFNKYLQEQFPNYASKKEQDLSLLGEMGTANFWADKVGNGVGFMLGAIASGAVTGGLADYAKAGKMAKGLATAAQLADEATQGIKGTAEVLGAVKNAASFTSQHGRDLLVGLAGSMGESGMEGRQIAHDTGVAVRKALVADAGGDPNDYENFPFTNEQKAHIKELEDASGNVGFGINLVLTGVENALLLPKVFRKGYSAEKVAMNAIEGSMEAGYKTADMSLGKKVAKTLQHLAIDNAGEATQEQLQYAVEQGLPDFYRKQRDPAATTDFNDAVNSTISGLGDAYGTKAGWENALLGGVIGIFGGAFKLGEVGAQQRTTQAAVQTLNDAIAAKPQQAMMRSMIAQNAFGKEKQAAEVSGDERKARDADFGAFSAMVRGFSQAGKIEDVVEDIEKAGTLSPEEFKARMGLDADAKLPELPAKMAAKQVEKVRQLHELSEQIEAAYPGDNNGGLRDAFFGIAAKSKDNEGREAKLAAEVYKTTGIPINTLVRNGNSQESLNGFADKISDWAAAPERLGYERDAVMQKAQDLLALSNERIQLASAYRQMEDPKHREAMSIAEGKLKDIADAKAVADKEAQEAAKAQPQNAPAGAAATAASDEEYAAFDEGDDLVDDAGVPNESKKPALSGNKTPYVTLNSGAQVYAELNEDGTVATYFMKQKVGEQSHLSYLPGSNGYLIAQKEPGLQAAVAAQYAAMKVEAAAKAGADAKVAADAKTAGEFERTPAQKAAIAAIEELKTGSPALKSDGSVYAIPESGQELDESSDTYNRATSLKKQLVDPRRNALLTKEDEEKSAAWLKENPQYAERGNIADLVIREFFIKGSPLTLAEAKAVIDDYAQQSKDSGKDIFNRLQVEDSYYEDVIRAAATLKDVTDKLGWHIISDVATLHGLVGDAKFAGTTDLVAVDKDGNLHILDLKTNEGSRVADYKKSDIGQGKTLKAGSDGNYMADESKYREGDLIQQAIYQSLLEQRLPGVKVVSRHIFSLKTTDTNNAKDTGLGIYKNANLEVQIGKSGLDSIAINLNSQTSIGQAKSVPLGTYTIDQLREHYATVPGQAAAHSQPGVSFFASNTENGELKEGTNMTTIAVGHMPLAVSVNGDTATVSINATMDVKQLLKAKLSTLEEFFEPAPGILNKEVKSVTAVQPAMMEKTDGVWKVKKDGKGTLLITYADGTTSADKAPSSQDPAPATKKELTAAKVALRTATKAFGNNAENTSQLDAELKGHMKAMLTTAFTAAQQKAALKFVEEMKGVTLADFHNALMALSGFLSALPPIKMEEKDLSAPLEKSMAPIDANFFSRLQGFHPNSWTDDDERATQLAIAAEWTKNMAANTGQRQEPVHIKVEGYQMNVYTNLNGKETKIGYIPTLGKGLKTFDTDEVKQAHDDLVALREQIKAYAQANPGQNIPLILNTRSRIDSAAEVQTEKSLAELDQRFMVSDGLGGLHHEIVEQHGQHADGVVVYTNPLTGSSVAANVSQSAKDSNLTNRYLMRVQRPDGNHVMIGVNAAPLTNAETFSQIQQVLASNIPEAEKAKALNELVFLSHKGPFGDGKARLGIAFIGDKKAVTAQVYSTEGVDEAGNPNDTPLGYLRFTAKSEQNTADGLLATMTYFPIVDGKVSKEGLPATEVVGMVRSVINKNDSPEERLAKLMPSTSAELWKDVMPHPMAIDAPGELASVVAEKEEIKADIIAAPVAASTDLGGEKAVKKLSRKESIAKDLADQLAADKAATARKVMPRTAEVLESEKFKEIESYVANKLPAGPDGFSVRQMMEQVSENGITVGYFLDMGINLAQSAPKGTGYHEAFHAVFRVLLNGEQRSKYYALAKRSTDLSAKAKDAFRQLHPQYAAMSEARLEAEMLEERMADLFSDYVKGKAVPMPSLFQKIVNFIKWLFTGGERPVHGQLRELFAQIDNGGFKNSTVRDVNSLNGMAAKKTLAFMNTFDSERTVRLLTGDFLKVFGESDKSVETEDMLNQVLETRKQELSKPADYFKGTAAQQEAQMKQQNYYQADEEELEPGEEAGRYYPTSFYYEEDRQALKQQVLKESKNWYRVETLDENQDEEVETVAGSDPDTTSERMYDQGNLSVQNKPGKEVVAFIKSTTYINPATGIREVVDYQPTVELLSRILDNKRTFAAMQATIVKLVAGGNQPQMAAVLNNITSKLATSDGPFFQRQFVKAFYTLYANPMVTLLNKETGETVRFSANRSTTELNLVNRWRESIEGKRRNPAILKAATKSFNEIFGRLNSVPESLEQRHADENALITSLGAMGIDISPTFLRNVMDGTDESYTWLSDKTNKRVLVDDLAQLSRQIGGNQNPFMRKVEDREGEANKSTYVQSNVGSGAISRGVALATADANYRQDIADSSAQGADGKPIFSRAQPSFIGERGADLTNGDYTLTGKPWLEHSLVVRYQRDGSNIIKNVRLRAETGIREEKTEDGLTPKDKDPKSYLLQEMANFRSKKGENVEREITFAQIEAKSSGMTITIPVYAPGMYFKDGKATKQGAEDLYFMGYQDFKNGEEAIVDLYPTLEYSTTYGPTAPPIEGVHFLKRALVVDGKEVLPGGYDKDGNPRLVNLATVREFQDSGKREMLPRIFQIVSLPSLNALTNEQLQSQEAVSKFLAGDKEEGRESFEQQALNDMKKSLAEAGLDVNNREDVKLMMGDKSGYKNIDEFLGDLLMTNLLWSDAYFRMTMGSQAWFAGDVDTTKRMAMMIAAGPSMGEGNHRFAALETHDSYLNAKTLLPITKAQYEAGVKADKASGQTSVRKADATDAQVYWTADMAKKFYMGIGKLTAATSAIWDKVIAGEKLTTQEQHLMLDEGVSLISAKGVYASQLADGSMVYLKFSAHVLSPELTSFQDSKGNWHAKPDMEAAHQLHQWMLSNRIDASGHDTAVKVGLRNKNFRDSKGMYSGDARYMELPNNGLREQMQNPSGKQKIIYPTQVLQLLDEGMQDYDKVELNGVEMSIKDVRDSYQQLFADVRKSLMEDAQIATQAIVSGNRLLVGQILSTLEASGASPTELSYFQHSESSPDFLHSTDLPSVNKRFQKLFLSVYNKQALALKAPGSKYTLVTSANTRVVIGPDGQLAHDWGKDFKDQDYFDKNFKLKEGYTTREMQMHGPESEVPGAPIRLAEVYLSEELLLNTGMTLKELYALDEATRNQIISQLGVRIPFQSHHSAMPFKVVGWVPAHYGSVVIAPAGITTLSGADYDIDSLYVLRKEFWQGKDKSWHVYGAGVQESVIRQQFIAKLEANMAESLGKKTLSDKDREKYADLYAEHEQGYAKFKKAYKRSHAFEEYTHAQGANKTLSAAKLAIRESAPWKEAAKRIEELGELLGDRKKKSKGSIAETREAVDPILQAIRSNLWLTTEETPAQFASFQKSTDQLLALAVAKTMLGDQLKKEMAKLDELRHQAHKDVRVAYTQQEYEALPKDKQGSTYATYGAIMDHNMAIIRNPANAESLTTPAETKPLQDIVKNFSAFMTQESAGAMPYNLISTRAAHQFNNMVGKANIGPAALANTVSALLTKHRYNFSKAFYFMGERMTGYANNLEHDITISPDGKVNVVMNSARKANSLSTLVSAMADNAKERIAAALNLTRDNLMPLANLVAMGYGLQRTMLFAGQPAMRMLSQRYRATMSVVDINANQTKVSENLIFEIETRMRTGKPQPGRGLDAAKERTKQTVVSDVAMTMKELRRELAKAIHPDMADNEDEAQVAQFTDLAQRANAAYDDKDLATLLGVYLEASQVEGVKLAPLSVEQQGLAEEVQAKGITKEEIGNAMEDQLKDLSFDLDAVLKSTGELTQDQYNALDRQIEILMEYGSLIQQTKYFKAVSTILSGNKGVGADFTGIQKIDDAREKTTMPIKKRKPAPVPGGIYLADILRAEHGLRQNLDNIDELKATLPKFFLARTDTAQAILASVKELMPGAKDEELLAAELDLTTFLAINAFQEMGNTTKNEFRLATMEGLFKSEEDNLGRKLEDLRKLAEDNPKEYGWLKNNAFLRSVSIRKPAPGTKETLYGISFNTRQKVSPEFAASLEDGFRELMGPASPETNAFAVDAFRYLAAKDNFQYKNGTFVSQVPELKFRDLSNSLKKIHQELLNRNPELGKLTGYNTDDAYRQFLATWFTNKTYRERVLGMGATPGDERYGILSEHFSPVADGLYVFDRSTVRGGAAMMAMDSVIDFPMVVARSTRKDSKQVLIREATPKGVVSKLDVAYYRVVPELKSAERAYYHLNAEELAAEDRDQNKVKEKVLVPTTAVNLSQKNLDQIKAGTRTLHISAEDMTAGLNGASTRLETMADGTVLRFSNYGTRNLQEMTREKLENLAKGLGYDNVAQFKTAAQAVPFAAAFFDKGELYVSKVEVVKEDEPAPQAETKQQAPANKATATSPTPATNQQTKSAIAAAVATVKLDDIRKLLANKELGMGEGGTEANYRNWLYKYALDTVLHGNTEMVNNLAHALSPKGRADNLAVTTANYEGDKEKAAFEDTLLLNVIGSAYSSLQATPTADQTSAEEASATDLPGVLQGDIFALKGIPVITTNLGGVHGAGLAQAAAAKGLITKGDGAFKATDTVVQLPVKKVWREKTDVALLKESLRSLWAVAKSNPDNTYLLPLAGIGHGEGNIEEIVPLLTKMLALPNIKLVIPGENVSLGRQATTRQDTTRQQMPAIKALLAKELLNKDQASAEAAAETPMTASVTDSAEEEADLADDGDDDGESLTGKGQGLFGQRLSAVKAAEQSAPMTPYVKELLANWKDVMKPEYQRLSDAARLQMAKDLESGKLTTTCTL